MQQRPFGKTGASVAAIGLGTWHMESDERASARDAIRAALDLGMTHIDTAELYGSGEVERLVGEAISGRRDEVFLASKVLPSNASFQGTLRACEQSLRRLQTDRLDLYLLHWPGSHPLQETFRAFERLVEQGKVRSWGVSNFDASELEEAVALAGEGRVACNQVLYHLEERYAERALLPLCEKHGVALVAYSPFGSGHFPSPRSEGGRALREIAQAHGTGVRQVALSFLTRDPHVFAIPKTSDPAHVRENAAASTLVLSEDEVARLDRAFAGRESGEGLPVI